MEDDSLVTITVRVKGLAWVYKDVEVTVPNDESARRNAKEEAYDTADDDSSSDWEHEGLHQIHSTDII